MKRIKRDLIDARHRAIALEYQLRFPAAFARTVGLPIRRLYGVDYAHTQLCRDLATEYHLSARQVQRIVARFVDAQQIAETRRRIVGPLE